MERFWADLIPRRKEHFPASRNVVNFERRHPAIAATNPIPDARVLHIEFDWTDGGKNKTREGLLSAVRASNQTLHQWLADA
jgi:hypothetical protein